MTSLQSPRSLFRDVGVLVSADAAAQFIGLFSLPIVTRLFAPDVMGTMTLVWAWVMGPSVIAALRYENTIVIEKETNNARSLFALCLIIICVFFICWCAIGTIFFNETANYFKLEEPNKILLWFIPAGILVVGINNTVSSWITRHGLFNLLAAIKLISGLVTAAFKIICGLLGNATAFVLLTSNWLGVVIPLLCVLPKLLRGTYRVIPLPSTKNIVPIAVRYREFPMYHSLAGFVNSVSHYAPMVLFGSFYTMEIVGFYGLATTALIRPVTMISNSLAKVLLQRIAHWQGRELLGEFRRITLTLAIMGSIPLSLVMIAGEELFGWVFGQEWEMAGQMAQVLAPWILVVFANTPATQFFIAKQHLRFLFQFQSAYAICRIFVVWLCAEQQVEAILTVTYFALTGIIFQIFYIAHAERTIRIKDNSE